MQALDGRVAVITGAASGIGRATAGALCRAGMRVVLADIEEAPLAAATQALRDAGHHVHGASVDVSDPSSVDALADEAWSTFGAVHLLHNNAGVGLAGPVWSATPADWQWVLGVNLHGVIHGIRSFVPRMIEQSSEGHIVNTSSMAGLAAPASLGVYATSKHGVIGVSEALRHDLLAAGLPFGVTVACPGVVTTHIADAERNRPARLQNPPQRPQEGLARHPSAIANIDPRDPALGVLEPMSAEAAADLIVDAVRNNRFLVLTHRDASRHLLRSHLEDLIGSPRN